MSPTDEQYLAYIDVLERFIDPLSVTYQGPFAPSASGPTVLVPATEKV
jgi:hypothetical protein